MLRELEDKKIHFSTFDHNKKKATGGTKKFVLHTNITRVLARYDDDVDDVEDVFYLLDDPAKKRKVVEKRKHSSDDSDEESSRVASKSKSEKPSKLKRDQTVDKEHDGEKS